MEKRLKDYLQYCAFCCTKIEDYSEEERKKLATGMLVQIGFFQHERLVHLLVTLTFAILALLTMICFFVAVTPVLLVALALFLILLIPYIRHYYILENGVQKLYEYYDIINAEKGNIMELWDIYDVNKKRTGRTMKRNDWNMQPGDYHLSVLGVIRRPDGKYLITKRAMDKAWAPGWWEVSGGAAQAGEDSEDAVKREILEETGLDVSGCPGGFVFSYRRDNPEEKDNYFVDIYRYEMDFTEEDVKLQEEETNGFMIADIEQIQAFAKEGIFLHYDSIKEVFI